MFSRLLYVQLYAIPSNCQLPYLLCQLFDIIVHSRKGTPWAKPLWSFQSWSFSLIFRGKKSTFLPELDLITHDWDRLKPIHTFYCWRNLFDYDRSRYILWWWTQCGIGILWKSGIAPLERTVREYHVLPTRLLCRSETEHNHRMQRRS